MISAAVIVSMLSFGFHLVSSFDHSPSNLSTTFSGAVFVILLSLTEPAIAYYDVAFLHPGEREQLHGYLG